MQGGIVLDFSFDGSLFLFTSYFIKFCSQLLLRTWADLDIPSVSVTLMVFHWSPWQSFQFTVEFFCF